MLSIKVSRECKYNLQVLKAIALKLYCVGLCYLYAIFLKSVNLRHKIHVPYEARRSRTDMSTGENLTQEILNKIMSFNCEKKMLLLVSFFKDSLALYIPIIIVKGP